jgi:hypothetical protein
LHEAFLTAEQHKQLRKYALEQIQKAASKNGAMSVAGLLSAKDPWTLIKLVMPSSDRSTDEDKQRITSREWDWLFGPAVREIGADVPQLYGNLVCFFLARDEHTSALRWDNQLLKRALDGQQRVAFMQWLANNAATMPDIASDETPARISGSVVKEAAGEWLLREIVSASTKIAEDAGTATDNVSHDDSMVTTDDADLPGE